MICSYGKYTFPEYAFTKCKKKILQKTVSAILTMHFKYEFKETCFVFNLQIHYYFHKPMVSRCSCWPVWYLPGPFSRDGYIEKLQTMPFSFLHQWFLAAPCLGNSFRQHRNPSSNKKMSKTVTRSFEPFQKSQYILPLLRAKMWPVKTRNFSASYISAFTSINLFLSSQAKNVCLIPNGSPTL
jgi:hypothetical protein